MLRIVFQDIAYFEIIIFVLHVWFMFGIAPDMAIEAAKINNSVEGAYNYMNYLGTTHFGQWYLIGMIVITAAMRVYFALKVTRLFGPFTKLIKFNAVNLVVWLIFMMIFLVVGSFYFMVLTDPEGDDGCQGLYGCMLVLIEAAVGKVAFRKMGSSWAGYLSLAAASIVLATVLVNMVIAKMNATYTDVVRKGTLHYYKELFNLRYAYQLHP